MISDKVLQKKIGWSPYLPKRHEAQIKILECKEPKVVIFAGKGLGKSMVCAYIALKAFLNMMLEVKQGKRDSIKIWIVAPTYELSRKVFSYFITWLLKVEPEFGPCYSDRAGPKLEVTKTIWVQGKSADEPQSLMGERLDLLIIDEAPYIKKSVWEHQLTPTMALSEENRTFLIGTPRGKNWVYQQWLWAKDHNAGFQFSSGDNPYLSQKRLEEIKETISKEAWEQEYLAIPQEQASSVFRNIRDIVNPSCLGEPQSGHRYVMGLDLAQIKDFTVAIILDKDTHQEKVHDRFKKIDYPLQIERIYNLARKYGAKVIVELNNIGQAIADELKARGVNVEGFQTQGTISVDKPGTKEQLIKKLSLDIENRNLTISDWEVLLDELDIFGQDLTPMGHIKYGAPEGYHDDCVMALALANWGLLGKRRAQNAEVAKVMPQRRKTFQYF